MFNRISGVYDFLNHLLSFNTDRRWRKRMARLAVRGSDPSYGAQAARRADQLVEWGLTPKTTLAAGLTPDTRAHAHTALYLDLCCGTGDSTIAIAKETDANALVVGLDFAENMLARMQRKISRRGRASKIAICKGDALRLPFQTGTFQAVATTFGIRNIPDRAAALREMLRVTRPGGRLVILEFVRPASGVMRGPSMFFLRRVLPFLGRLFSGDQYNAYSYLPQSIMTFPTAEEFRREMLAAGCSHAACEFARAGLVAFFTGTK